MMSAPSAIVTGEDVDFAIFDHIERRDGPLAQLYAERLDYVAAAEAAGFSRYFKSEHHLTPLDAAPSSGLFLAAAAQRTSTIRLVPLVYLLPFHHPLRLIEEIAMLDGLSSGRLEVGIGRGVAPPEHDMWGLDPTTAREHTEEALAVILAGLTSDRLDHHGRFYSFTGVPMEMQTLQRPYPALWYPGNVEVAAGRGFHTVVGGPIPTVAASVRRYWELWEHGDAMQGGVNAHLETPPLVACATRVFVAATDRQAEDRARRAWAVYTHNITLLWRRAGIDLSTMPLDPSCGGDFDRAVTVGAAVVGSASKVADHVAAVATDSGADMLVTSLCWGDLDHAESMASMELYASSAMAPLLATTTI